MKRKMTLADVYARVDALHRHIRHFGLMHTDLVDGVDAIRQELAAKTPAGARRYSQHIASAFEGYATARYNDIWQHLEYVYRSPTGELYSTYKGTTLRSTEELYKADRAQEMSKWPHAYVWSGKTDQFTPFQTYEEQVQDTRLKAMQDSMMPR